MVITLLLDMIYHLLDFLLLFEIPSLPTEAQTYISQFFDYLATGASIFSNYAPLGYLLVLLGIIIAVDSGILIYHFVLWVLKKIPVINVK